MVLKDYFYVGVSLCSLHVSNIFCGRDVFICMPDVSFLRVTIIPLMENIISIVLTRTEWTLGVGDGQGGLVCCTSWGRKESDMTEQLNWTGLNWTRTYSLLCSHLSSVKGSTPQLLEKALRSSPKVFCVVGNTGVLPLGKELMYISPKKLSTNTCTLWCHLSSGVCAHKISSYWHCLSPCFHCPLPW